jgi:exopolysaccharide biosynthesis WecB/TagA/CpsF family protein
MSTARVSEQTKPATPVRLRLDDHDLAQFVTIAQHFGWNSYAYVVTPNVDHVIRYYDDAAFRQLYAQARYVLLDSRFLSRLLRLLKQIRPLVCRGSDLTLRLFEAAAPEDRIVLIGASAAQAQQLAQRYGLRNLQHHNPPMGFIHDPQALDACLRFVERHSPFRFCFLAVGSPQQEMVAQALEARGVARGLALCIGASINFLTGSERRAPGWMQWLGVEWLFRLLQDPRRLARRYLRRGPRIFALLPRIEFELRQ